MAPTEPQDENAAAAVNPEPTTSTPATDSALDQVAQQSPAPVAPDAAPVDGTPDQPAPAPAPAQPVSGAPDEAQQSDQPVVEGPPAGQPPLTSDTTSFEEDDNPEANIGEAVPEPEVSE